jgi:hypothetical protein
MQLNSALKLASLALALSVSLANAQTSEVARYPSENYTDAAPHKSAFAASTVSTSTIWTGAAMDRSF